MSHNRRLPHRRVVPVLALLGLVAAALLPPAPTLASSAEVATAPAVAGWDPAAACAKLPTTSFEQVPGAPTRVEAAAVVPAGAGLPEYCRVTGYVSAQIHFEIRLPTRSWNGSYYQTGCGGLCGNIPIASCSTALARDFAVAAENTGHESSSRDALWAYDNPLAKAEYGYLSPHMVSLAGKAITTAYYGQRPRQAVFEGCSNGGRQGVELATRYPTDFNGIIVRDPAIHGAQTGMYFIWVTKVNQKADGTKILTADRLPLVHNAVLAACDTLDGAADHVLADPTKCHWNPASIQCKPHQAPTSCLTPAEVKVVQQFYTGPTDSHGKELYPVNSKAQPQQVGSLQRGSELEWANPGFDLISATPGKLSATDTYASQFYRYLIFPKDRGPTADYLDFDYDHDPQRLDNRYVGTGSVNLAAFHRAGGRLLLIQDFADQAVPPTSMITYYKEAFGANGRTASKDWMRLFMVPGTPHCNANSSAPGVIDGLTAMTDWLATHRPPSTLTARQLGTDGSVVAQRVLTPYAV